MSDYGETDENPSEYEVLPFCVASVLRGCFRGVLCELGRATIREDDTSGVLSATLIVRRFWCVQGAESNYFLRILGLFFPWFSLVKRRFSSKNGEKLAYAS